MKTEYTLYQWKGNTLVDWCNIPFPYFTDNSLNIPEHIINLDCDHLTIRRVRTNNNGDRKAAIIESVYR